MPMPSFVVIWVIADIILLYLYCKVLGLRTRETWYIFTLTTVLSAIALTILHLAIPNQ